MVAVPVAPTPLADPSNDHRHADCVIRCTCHRYTGQFIYSLRTVQDRNPRIYGRLRGWPMAAVPAAPIPSAVVV
jgi:hypothetical protein